MITHFLTNAKAYAATIGAAATALAAILTPDSQLALVVGAIGTLATALATWRIPNLTTTPPAPKSNP